MQQLSPDNNNSWAENTITPKMGRQRKTHKKSHEGCEQCKDRHIKVRRPRPPSSTRYLRPRRHGIIKWLSHNHSSVMKSTHNVETANGTAWRAASRPRL